MTWLEHCSHLQKTYHSIPVSLQMLKFKRQTHRHKYHLKTRMRNHNGLNSFYALFATTACLGKPPSFFFSLTCMICFIYIVVTLILLRCLSCFLGLVVIVLFLSEVQCQFSRSFPIWLRNVGLCCRQVYDFLCLARSSLKIDFKGRFCIGQTFNFS